MIQPTEQNKGREPLNPKDAEVVEKWIHNHFGVVIADDQKMRIAVLAIEYAIDEGHSIEKAVAVSATFLVCFAANIDPQDIMKSLAKHYGEQN